MKRSIIFVLIVIQLVLRVKKSFGQFQSLEQDKFDGDSCTAANSGKGKCMAIQKCSVVRQNIRNKIYNHTVCGYQELNQIVCCPSSYEPETAPDRSPTRAPPKLNFTLGYDCEVNGTPDEIGVIKFIQDCPGLNRKDNTNILCKHQICRDLVCCPIQNFNRHKTICSHVDDPQEEITVKLYSNQKCKVRGLNMTGIYQKECDFAKRNKNLTKKLQDVCDDRVCENRFCCPITEPTDKLYCDSQAKLGHIEFKGPKCVDSKTKRNGTCRLAKNCVTADPNELDLCGTNCCHEYLCCPDVDLTKELLVTKKCWEYTKSRVKKEVEIELQQPTESTEDRTDCLFDISVAGGFEVKPGEYPHMTALGYQIADEPIQWSCGGSLISERYILTAGHCLSSPESGTVKYVRMGVIHLRTNVSISSDCPEDFTVENIVPHPNYDKRYVYNDIGLIRLDRDVKFNYHIRPICLPASPDVPEYFYSMGWGALGSAEEQSVNLIQVGQELFSHKECADLYKYLTNRRFKEGVKNDTQICAGSRTGIQSTCGGDSGGPLLALNQKFRFSRTYTIFGIVSFGTVCGFPNSPGIYTKVYPFVNWIKGIVWM